MSVMGSDLGQDVEALEHPGFLLLGHLATLHALQAVELLFDVVRT